MNKFYGSHLTKTGNVIPKPKVEGEVTKKKKKKKKDPNAPKKPSNMPFYQLYVIDCGSWKIVHFPTPPPCLPTSPSPSPSLSPLSDFSPHLSFFAHTRAPPLCAPPSSPALATVCGEEKLRRTEVVKQIWAYIKGKDLQNPENKREIICDAKLKAVFDGNDRVTMFTLNKFLSAHLTKIEGDQ